MRIESDLEHWIRWHLYRRRKISRRSGALRDFHDYLRKLPAGSLCVDCGANLGDIARLMRRKGCRVIAFEPDPVAVQHLARRFAGDPGVTIIQKAVGGENRKAMFYQRPDVAGNIRRTQGSSLIQKKTHSDAPVAEVDVIDLPEFITGLGDPVALLKVDIEGAEAELLETLLDRGVHRGIGRIYVETHERFSPELARRIAEIRRRIEVERITNINLDWT